MLFSPTLPLTLLGNVVFAVHTVQAAPSASLASDMQETSTCHYVLTVAVPGLCQLPIFRAQAEPITQIICRPVAAPAAETSSTDHESQQQQHALFVDGDLVQDESDHDSSMNSTESDSRDS